MLGQNEHLTRVERCCLVLELPAFYFHFILRTSPPPSPTPILCITTIVCHLASLLTSLSLNIIYLNIGQSIFCGSGQKARLFRLIREWDDSLPYLNKTRLIFYLSLERLMNHTENLTHKLGLYFGYFSWGLCLLLLL